MNYTFNQWLDSLKHYALMCLLLSGPDRLVVNLNNILLSLFCYFLIGFALIDEQRGYLTIIMQFALDLLLLALVSYVGLKWKNLLSRLPQTFSALLGVNIIITAVSIPAYGLSVPVINWLVVFLYLAAISQIFKQAFNINTLPAAIISFTYFVFYAFLFVRIF